MKITGIKTHIFSSQHRNAKRNWLILRLLTDEGVEGIGEASMLSYDPMVASLLHEWAEAYLVGKNPLHHEVHWTRMYQDNLGRGGRLFSTALSGIDIALWDLRGKALGVPVYELLGGPTPTASACMPTAGTRIRGRRSRTARKQSAWWRWATRR